VEETWGRARYHRQAQVAVMKPATNATTSARAETITATIPKICSGQPRWAIGEKSRPSPPRPVLGFIRSMRASDTVPRETRRVPTAQRPLVGDLAATATGGHKLQQNAFSAADAHDKPPIFIAVLPAQCNGAFAIYKLIHLFRDGPDYAFILRTGCGACYLRRDCPWILVPARGAFDTVSRSMSLYRAGLRLALSLPLGVAIPSAAFPQYGCRVRRCEPRFHSALAGRGDHLLIEPASENATQSGLHA
jgi:hypothetical protein